MPVASIQKIIRGFTFNDLGDQIEFVDDVWGPTDGHYDIIPVGAGKYFAATLQSIRVILSVGEGDPLPTVGDVVFAADPSGLIVYGSAAASFGPKPDGDGVIAIFQPEISFSCNPSMPLNLVPQEAGHVYLIFRFNADCTGDLVFVDLALEDLIVGS